MRCLVNVTHTDHGVWSSHFSVCLSIYIYLSCYFVLTNTVFLNTTSGSRKPPEYFIFASHDKFKNVIHTAKYRIYMHVLINSETDMHTFSIFGHMYHIFKFVMLLILIIIIIIITINNINII
jgi:hypothetical protein